MAHIFLATIGLCEHCGTLLNLDGMPADAMNAEWPCPKCKKNTTGESFGYKEVNLGNWKKVRWVGKVGNKFGWVTEKPTEDYKIGNTEVWVELLAPPI